MNSIAEVLPVTHKINLSGRLDANRIINDPESLVGEVPDSVAGLLLNISDVSFIDSSGLGYLVSVYKQLTEKGQKFIICEPTAQARMLFELTRMHQIFSIFDDEEQAAECIR
jgi:anti-anti-sigma factor